MSKVNEIIPELYQVKENYMAMYNALQAVEALVDGRLDDSSLLAFSIKGEDLESDLKIILKQSKGKK